ncbi:MAG: hypothetical protein AAFX08_12575 [Pseudomonadota bacterium]
MTIAERSAAFSEKERIEKLYLPGVKDRSGEKTVHQLVRFEFKERSDDVPTNGYSENELFIGEAANGDQIAIFCVREQSSVSSPHCWREFEITENVTLTYKFKKPYLPEWRAIDAQVRKFIDAIAI